MENSKQLIFLFLIGWMNIMTVNCVVKTWSWRCTDMAEGIPECIKERTTVNGQSTGQMTLNKCKLVCGKYGSLLPRPQVVTLGDQTMPFSPSKITFNNVNCLANICPLLTEASLIMKNNIEKYNPDCRKNHSNCFVPVNEANIQNSVHVNFHVTGGAEYLELDTDESYQLDIKVFNDNVNATINAPTFFGARHGLETLSQLIDYDEDNNSLQIVTLAIIQDWPEFPYRGFIIDTSRNFITLDKIKKTVDAMAYNKLNTFHWHITDSHSFPLEINSLPNMATYGAYSQREIYHPSDVRDLVQYARVRGIRVLPEIDAPAHVGHGWQWGEEMGLGKLVVCLDKKPWTSYCVEPPCGQMNLANPQLYNVLGTIYDEVVDMFSPIDLFHYGGDEININCWNTSQEITEWMAQNGYGNDVEAYIKQWSVFQEKAKNLITKSNKNKPVPGILWTSKLTEKEHLGKYVKPEDYIIQLWTTGTDPIIKDILEKNYRVIFSNYDAFYLDCGAASWVGKGTNWCSPYKGWQDIYDNDILGHVRNLNMTSNRFGQVLGGEAAMWTEQVDSNSLENKLWPRGSALAERLWTNPKGGYRTAEHRMLQHRNRMVSWGVQASRLQPEWCRQNQGQCKMV